MRAKHKGECRQRQAPRSVRALKGPPLLSAPVSRQAVVLASRGLRAVNPFRQAADQEGPVDFSLRLLAALHDLWCGNAVQQIAGAAALTSLEPDLRSLIPLQLVRREAHRQDRFGLHVARWSLAVGVWLKAFWLTGIAHDGEDLPAYWRRLRRRAYCLVHDEWLALLPPDAAWARYRRTRHEPPHAGGDSAAVAFWVRYRRGLEKVQSADRRLYVVTRKYLARHPGATLSEAYRAVAERFGVSESRVRSVRSRIRRLLA